MAGIARLHVLPARADRRAFGHRRAQVARAPGARRRWRTPERTLSPSPMRRETWHVGAGAAAGDDIGRADVAAAAASGTPAPAPVPRVVADRARARPTASSMRCRRATPPAACQPRPLPRTRPTTTTRTHSETRRRKRRGGQRGDLAEDKEEGRSRSVPSQWASHGCSQRRASAASGGVLPVRFSAVGVGDAVDVVRCFFLSVLRLVSRAPTERRRVLPTSGERVPRPRRRESGTRAAAEAGTDGLESFGTTVTGARVGMRWTEDARPGSGHQ